MRKRKGTVEALVESFAFEEGVELSSYFGHLGLFVAYSLYLDIAWIIARYLNTDIYHILVSSVFMRMLIVFLRVPSSRDQIFPGETMI